VGPAVNGRVGLAWMNDFSNDNGRTDLSGQGGQMGVRVGLFFPRYIRNKKKLKINQSGLDGLSVGKMNQSTTHEKCQ